MLFRSFLAAQIFNLAEGWDGGVLLWAIGAALGWLLLRDWVQATFTALLAPAWLLAKWVNTVPDTPKRELILAEGLCLLAITYFTARISEETSVVRRSLMWIGGLALIPCTIRIPWAEESYYRQHYTLNTSTEVLGWTVAFLAPLALAVLLRGSRSWSNILAALWVLILGSMQFESLRDQDLHGLVFLWHEIGPYLWCAIGSVAMIAWGLREARKERVNLGVLGFGLTIACFYFSSVMDKLGRSESLIGFGALFLIGGWFLERARRRLIARMNTRPA